MTAVKTSSSLMSAVVCKAYGDPDVLEYTQVPRPTIGPRDVLVQVRATTVTVADFRLRTFTIPRSVWLPARLMLGIFKPRQPILGAELSGDVVAVGDQVTKWQVGQPVFAATLQSFGGYAHFARLPQEGAMSKKPVNLTYEEAAAIPVGARTALHYLRKAMVGPGQHVLIYGASGSVGTYAIQLAKYIGAKVIAVCSAANRQLVLSLGADEVVDYQQPQWQERLGVYDVVMDAVNHFPYPQAYPHLIPGGSYLNVTEPFAGMRNRWLAGKKGHRLIMGESPSQKSADMDYLACLASKGAIKPHIDRSYRLSDIREAHRYVGKGHKKGNVTVHVGE